MNQSDPYPMIPASANGTIIQNAVQIECHSFVSPQSLPHIQLINALVSAIYYVLKHFSNPYTFLHVSAKYFSNPYTFSMFLISVAYANIISHLGSFQTGLVTF